MKKKNMVAASAALALTVGLSACGHSTPTAQPGTQPFPVERACADVPKPADPRNLIGDNWLKDDACAIFNMNRPGAGVSQEQAEKIVFDARMKALVGKRDLVMLVQQGTKQADNPTGVITDFKSAVAQRRASLKAELEASSLALQGQASQGYSISYVKGEGR